MSRQAAHWPLGQSHPQGLAPTLGPQRASNTEGGRAGILLGTRQGEDLVISLDTVF